MSNRTPAGLRAAIGALLIVGMPYFAFSQAPTADVAFLVIRVPGDAKVVIGGDPTTATGTERTFVTPALKAGRKYSYVVVATWTADGKPKQVERTVRFKAGDSAVIDLTRPEAEKPKDKPKDTPKAVEKPKDTPKDKPKDKPKAVEKPKDNPKDKPKEDLKGAEKLKLPTIEGEKKAPTR